MKEMWIWSLGQEDPLGWEDNLEKAPAPVFFLGISHGQGGLRGYSPWGESDMAEQLSMHTHNKISGFISPHKVSSKMPAQYVWDAEWIYS